MNKSRHIIAGGFLFIGLGGIVDAEADDGGIGGGKSRWEFGGGFGIRQSFDLQMSSPARDLTGALYDVDATRAALTEAVGPADSAADRLYDDGFVNIGSNVGLTTDWGYDSASQVRQGSQAWDPSQPWDAPGNQSLYLSRSGELASAGMRRNSEAETELFPYLDLKRIWKAEGGRSEYGWMTSWSWIPASSRMSEGLEMTQMRVTDEYFLYGITPPSAPYIGPALPPGPLLDDIPHDRVFTENADGYQGVFNSKMKMDLQTISLGGIWRLLPNRGGLADSLGLSGLEVQGGASLNAARIRLRSTTTITDSLGNVVGSYGGNSSTDKLRGGLYLSVASMLDLHLDHWHLATQARYDHAGSMKVSSGGASAKLELDGWSLMFGLVREW